MKTSQHTVPKRTRASSRKEIHERQCHTRKKRECYI